MPCLYGFAGILDKKYDKKNSPKIINRLAAIFKTIFVIIFMGSTSDVWIYLRKLNPSLIVCARGMAWMPPKYIFLSPPYKIYSSAIG